MKTRNGEPGDRLDSRSLPRLRGRRFPTISPRFRRSMAVLARAGTAGYPPDVRRRLEILNLIAYLIAATTLVYALNQAIVGDAKYRPIVVVNVALVLVMIAVPFTHRFSEIAGGMLIVFAEYVALTALTAYLGRSSGLHLQLIVIAAAAFVVLGLSRLWLIIPVILAGLALHLVLWFRFPQGRALIETEPEFLDSLYTQAAVTTFGLIAATVFYAFRLAEAARAETDALLRNILPDSIVERLKARPADAIADSFSEASILFADISGFVALARRLGAVPTVELLNLIVHRFDALCEQHGVEKIKTIGDGYMVASGIPDPRADHVLRLARMGLDMQSVIAELRSARGLELEIRIGLATGPVMAGVIGRHKFTYDVWGDAVNLAARLENLSKPGRIHVCPLTRQALEGDFELECRGPIEIKGVGAQETWFLVGPRLRPSG